MLLAICHSAESGWTEVKDLDQLSDLRAQAGNVLWAEADVANLTPDDVATIAEEFDLHPLAVEDAMNTRQRPKSEGYTSHRFLVFHQLDRVDDQLEATQIASFVGERFVVTIHAGAERTIERAKERWKDTRTGEDSGALLHVLVDVVVDEYQDIADELESDIEELEEITLARPDAPIQQQLYSLKQRLARMRRYVLPAGRALEWAIDPRRGAISSLEVQARFRDVHDHLMRIGDQIRNVDDLAQAVIDFTRAEQANSLNLINRRLSAWAAIFAVLTVIGGVYGMNFELVPAEQSLTGFWFAIGLMVVCAGGLFFYFRRRGWL